MSAELARPCISPNPNFKAMAGTMPLIESLRKLRGVNNWNQLRMDPTLFVSSTKSLTLNSSGRCEKKESFSTSGSSI